MVVAWFSGVLDSCIHWQATTCCPIEVLFFPFLNGINVPNYNAFSNTHKMDVNSLSSLSKSQVEFH